MVRLAAVQHGRGRTILLVHGSGTDHRDWHGVQQLLPGRSLAVDRRGRGASPDVGSYSLEAEVMDVVETARGVRASALVGHSFGAVVALEACRHLPLPTVAYEPPILDEEMATGLAGVADALDQIDDPDERLAVFLRDAAGATPEELVALRADVSWAWGVAAAPTLPREARAIARYAFPATRLPAPVLVLVGSESPPFFDDAAKRVVAAGAQQAVLQGQGHNALALDPAQVADHVTRFLAARPVPGSTGNVTEAV